MPIVRRTLLGLAAASLAAGTPPPRGAALAATDTDQLTVTATVLSGCALNGGSISFGQYTSGQSADLESQGQINYVNCTGTLRFELDSGAGADGSSRRMSLGSNRLRYQLYRNPNRSNVWGSGTEAVTIQTIGDAPQSASVVVYGRIFGGQLAAPGNYSDTVNITLTF